MPEQKPSAETHALLRKVIGDVPIIDIVTDAEAHIRESLQAADARALRRAASCMMRLREIARQCQQEVNRLKGFGPIGAPSLSLYWQAAEFAADLQRIANEMDPDGAEQFGPDPDYDILTAE